MLTYTAEQVWTPLSELLLDWDDAFHELMLNDRLRMAAYRRSIRETVRPGDVVLDLGTGTGILSQWALEAGASRVIGVEMNAAMLQRAVERMQGAGLSASFEPINRLSYEVSLRQPVDVLVSEIIGNMADNEDFQPILEDAFRRLLKPGGKMLPRSVSSYLVPVAAARAHAALSAGTVATLAPRYDVGALYRDKCIASPFNLYYDCILPRALYLSRPQQVSAYGGAWDQPATYCRTLSFVLNAPGLLTGFKCYFVAQLSATTSLDISGDDIAEGLASDSWKHAYLPIERPIEVREGDSLELVFSRSYPGNGHCPFRQVYRWQGSVLRQGRTIARFDQCMDESVFIR